MSESGIKIAFKIGPHQQDRIIHTDGVIPTIPAGHHLNAQWMNLILDKDMAKVYKIRKLTSRECFRLMGVSDADIDKIKAADISETQQYKMAGNSIVVDVLEGIFTQMFKFNEDTLF